MSELCAPFDPEVREMFKRKLGLTHLPAGATYIAYRDDEGVTGGWMFERYTGPGGSVCAHWAANKEGRWLTKQMLNMAALYVFGQLRCKFIMGEVAASDEYVRRVDERLGFEEHATIRGYFPDDDLVIYRLDRNRCRWLPAEYRQEFTDG
jgi:RimJ/RimL family protein N-acetyltransferase